MTYSEKSTQLACDSSVVVLAVSNPECTDIEFLPLRPRHFSDIEQAALAARWGGRNLRSIGVFGLVGTSPRCAFKEELEPEQVTALADAFLAYLHVLFADSFAEQREDIETQELRRLFALCDPYSN